MKHILLLIVLVFLSACKSTSTAQLPQVTTDSKLSVYERNQRFLIALTRSGPKTLMAFSTAEDITAYYQSLGTKKAQPAKTLIAALETYLQQLRRLGTPEYIGSEIVSDTITYSYLRVTTENEGSLYIKVVWFNNHSIVDLQSMAFNQATVEYMADSHSLEVLPKIEYDQIKTIARFINQKDFNSAASKFKTLPQSVKSLPTVQQLLLRLSLKDSASDAYPLFDVMADFIPIDQFIGIGWFVYLRDKMRYAHAQTQLSLLPEILKNDADLLAESSGIHLKLGRRQQAWQDIYQILLRASDNPTSLPIAAQLAINMGNYQKGVELFKLFEHKYGVILNENDLSDLDNASLFFASPEYKNWRGQRGS